MRPRMYRGCQESTKQCNMQSVWVLDTTKDHAKVQYTRNPQCSREGVDQPPVPENLQFLNASSQQAARHTYSSQPSAIHLVLSQQAANTHPSSSQPAVTTQSQPTMPCGASASASANGNGFTATGMN
ncbi:hypothetical protein ACSBR2_041042 [Camellia fascicularis]